MADNTTLTVAVYTLVEGGAFYTFPQELLIQADTMSRTSEMSRTEALLQIAKEHAYFSVHFADVTDTYYPRDVFKDKLVYPGTDDWAHFPTKGD